MQIAGMEQLEVLSINLPQSCLSSQTTTMEVCGTLVSKLASLKEFDMRHQELQELNLCK